MGFSAEQLLEMYAPALASQPSAANWLQLGRDSLSSGVLGSDYPEAVALFAAHRMTMVSRMALNGGAVGAVTSQSVGSISQSYGSGSPRAGFEELAQTGYGLRLQQLILNSGASIQVLDAGEPLPGSGIGDIWTVPST